VAKVDPSFENTMQFIVYFAAFVGFAIASPFSALYTTKISEMTTNRKLPSLLYVHE
jgi:hypothetical protein